MRGRNKLGNSALVVSALLMTTTLISVVAAEPAPRDLSAIGKLAAATGGSAKVSIHRATGAASFVRLAPGSLKLAAATDEVRARVFFQHYGGVFGIADPGNELVTEEVRSDHLGNRRVSFSQEHRQVPVFGAQLRAHFDGAGALRAVNGTFVPDLEVDTSPSHDLEALTTAALGLVGEQFPEATGLAAGSCTLYVYRQGLLRGTPGSDHLVYEIEVTNGGGVHEIVYVDAHTRKVVNQITGIHQAIDRRIYETRLDPDFLVWEEGDTYPYVGVPPDTNDDPQINGLIDFAEDVYELFSNLSGGTFLSWDGADAVMHSIYDADDLFCPNAVWDGTSTNFCDGVTGDDTVAHEWIHAYTDSTHDLIYQWQPGALNESYSDIFGEVVDVINGAGTDTPDPPRTAGACSTFGGGPPPACTVNSPPEIAGAKIVSGAAFNPAGPITVTGDVELVDDGTEPSATDGCESLVGFTAGSIALVDRGSCEFTAKVLNAQAAGATGVKIVNNVPGLIEMGGTDPSITIPSVMMLQTDGNEIKSELVSGTVGATIELPGSSDASVRWLSGEDDPATGGAVRDLWNPTCFGHPGRVGDVAQYVCDSSDSGGVHTNSGVPNHAFALLVDGGAYNGMTVTGLGMTKAAHLYWRAMSVYQTPASDFADHAIALAASCADLVAAGTKLADLSTGAPSGQVMTTADCNEVADAMVATEMSVPPGFCAFEPLLDSDAPPVEDCAAVFSDNFDSDPAGTWTLTNEGVEPEYTPRDWEWTAELPAGGTGSAFFAVDGIDVGDCVPDGNDQSGVMHLDSPEVILGNDSPQLVFDHWVATEALWDGGNVKVSVNHGPFEPVAGADYSFNPYNAVLRTTAANNTNPMQGEEAFTGSDGGSVSGSWGQSQVDLSGYASPGDSVVIRFDFGVDRCNGLVGWYVDNVEVQSCDYSAPQVEIIAPPDGASFSQGTTIAFAGFATDDKDDDDNLSDRLMWTSSPNLRLGEEGGCFFLDAADFSLGFHTVVASVTDSDGLSGSAQVTIEITAPLAQAASSPVRGLGSIDSAGGFPRRDDVSAAGDKALQCPELDLKMTASRTILRPGTMRIRSTVSEIGCIPGGGSEDLIGVEVMNNLPQGVGFVVTNGCLNDPGGLPYCGLGTVPVDTSATYAAFLCIGESAGRGDVDFCATATAKNAAPTTACVTLSSLIFSDGFESGDTSVWSSTTP